MQTSNGFKQVARNGQAATAGNANSSWPLPLEGDQLAQMRPVLAIFLGGTGQLMAVNLMALLNKRFGGAWREKIRILVFDTTDEPLALPVGTEMVQLEAGANFFQIGQVPLPRILRNLKNLESINERFGTVLNRLPAGVMRGNGAKSIRPLGLMALYWHYHTVMRQIRTNIWNLAGRDLNTGEASLQQQGINVVIGCSLIGGSGSGMFLDVAHMVRQLFDELGDQGQFCHLTGIGLLPQAFQRIVAPHMRANAGAALAELNHLMSRGGFAVQYPGGQRVSFPAAPFDIFHVLDGVDEGGRTWTNSQEVAAMAAEGILLQMASQLGRKGENAFDNLDEVLVGHAGSERTFLSSFGLGYLEFPAATAAQLLAHWLVVQQAQAVWLAPPDGATATVAQELASKWLSPIGASQLVQELMRDAHGSVLSVDLHQPTWLGNAVHTQVAGEAAGYIRTYGRTRVNEELLTQLNQNASAVIDRQQAQWSAWVNAALFVPDSSLAVVEQTLREADTELGHWLQQSTNRLSELDDAQQQHGVALRQAEADLVVAADGLFLGRSGRVRQALNSLFTVAEQYYTLQVEHEHLRLQRRVWSEVRAHLATLAQQVQTLRRRLARVTDLLLVAAGRELERLQRGRVATITLADEAYLRELYAAYAPATVALQPLLPAGWEPLDLARLDTEALGAVLLQATSEIFEAVRQMDIEQVIAARENEMSRQARLQQLANLARPSWSIERARLPEGGAGLARVEVLGVPDANKTLFKDVETLVSTHDSTRLVALVVVAGAPPGALQQYHLYRQQLESLQRQRPMFVLPNFMAHTSQAPLAFALGSIFGFIYNQGTYFYYRPADELASPIRLDNGLANALAALETREELVQGIMERVDGQIAQLGLQQAIDILADYYATLPAGRSSLDDLSRELKQLVRDYAAELQQIEIFRSGLDR